MKYRTKNKNVRRKAKIGIAVMGVAYMAITMILFAPSQTIAAFEKHEITPDIMIKLTNQSRTVAGVPTLIVNEKLLSAANAKADDMFKNQYFNHKSPGGISPWFWIKQAGYKYSFAGENLAIDFLTAEGAHSAFMNSSSHKQNILNSKYTEIGIAVKKGMFEGRESIIIVELFAQPYKAKNVAPAILKERKSTENSIVAVKDSSVNKNLQAQTIQNSIAENATLPVNEIGAKEQITISPAGDAGEKKQKVENNIEENSIQKSGNVFEVYMSKDFSSLTVYFSQLSSSSGGDEKYDSKEKKFAIENTEEWDSGENVFSLNSDSGKIALLAFSISAILNMIYISSKNMK